MPSENELLAPSTRYSHDTCCRSPSAICSGALLETQHLHSLLEKVQGHTRRKGSSPARRNPKNMRYVRRASSDSVHCQVLSLLHGSACVCTGLASDGILRDINSNPHLQPKRVLTLPQKEKAQLHSLKREIQLHSGFAVPRAIPGVTFDLAHCSLQLRDRSYITVICRHFSLNSLYIS